MDLASKYVNERTVPVSPRLHSTRERKSRNSVNKPDPTPFRARPMPDFSKPAPVRMPRPCRQRTCQRSHSEGKDGGGTKELYAFKMTTPEPFNLESIARHNRAVAEFEQKKEEMDEAEELRRIFKAQPLREDMLHKATFVPVLGTTPLTEPEDVITASRKRADRRAQFDQHTAERLNAEERHRAEMLAARQAQEEEEMRKHWKEHGFRARPVPSSTYRVPPTLHRSLGCNENVVRRCMSSRIGSVNRSAESDKSLSRRSMGSLKSWSNQLENKSENLKTPLKLSNSESSVESNEKAASLSPYSPSDLLANMKRVIQRYQRLSPTLGSPT